MAALKQTKTYSEKSDKSGQNVNTNNRAQLAVEERKKPFAWRLFHFILNLNSKPFFTKATDECVCVPLNQ